MQIDCQDIVEEVMRHWPQTIRIFLDHHMSCPGCSLSGFETLAEAGRTYGLDQERFLGELREAASLAMPE